MQYHPLITEYFESQKPFALAHPETGETAEFRIHGLDFGFDAGEIETSHFEQDDGGASNQTWRYPVSLPRLLDILQSEKARIDKEWRDNLPDEYYLDSD